jgi:predicted Rossmann fold nucleotide-binding protein DprA/Smf involved in DNA uptake
MKAINVEYLGNQELLKLQKTAFLASSNISSEMVLRVYDWATDMRSRRECVVSGFNSKLEQDVLHFLLKGSQPIILVLARRMYKVIPKELQEALTLNRLLIVSVSNAARQSKNTAMMRNKWLCEMADRILLVGVSERSSLYALQEDIKNKQKLITV